MRSWLVGACAVLMVASAHAQEGSEHYTTAGAWEVAVEPGGKLCKMYRFYGSNTGKGTEGLVVRYDAVNEAAMLTWTTQNMAYLPASGDLELFLNFVDGKKFNDTWGGRAFRYQKPQDTYYFTHRFTGAKETNRFLRDLGSNEMIGLDLGPVMLTALFLEASDATKALRECSLKVSGRASENALAH